MDPHELRQVESRLSDFLEYCLSGMGRLERREALDSYLRGLLLDGERKSMVPIAARLAEAPEQTEAIRQRLQQAITVARWDEGELFRRIAAQVHQRLPEIEAYVVDDTGFPKTGSHSVGVQRQYSGTLGRIDNCQVATSLHLASEHGGACIGARLYLPEAWTEDAARRKKVGIPGEVEFKKKWELALELLDRALSWGLPKQVVLADAGYGDAGTFRQGLRARGLDYVLAVASTAVVWPPGQMPSPPPARPPGKKGPKPTKWRDGDAQAVTIAELAVGLPKSAWRTVTWRQGSRGKQSSRFARVRVRTAHRHKQGKPPGVEQWLVCEWPKGEDAPSKFYLSCMSTRTTLKRLVYLAKLRWRIERDYREMKSELGLDHFEGRGWVGFHHHFACVAAAHAFLALERALFPPQR
jgi:SRSO17 transposase